jgi:hypothetical protein
MASVLYFHNSSIFTPKPSSWRTTPFRLPATAYSIYSQLPSISFPKYHTKYVLGDFTPKICREDIFEPIGNESLHEIINDIGIRVVNFDIIKNLTVRSTMRPHRNIPKFMWTSPDGKTHNHIELHTKFYPIFFSQG